MIATDVRLVAVTGRTHAEQILEVHEATATQAYAHIFSGPFPRAYELAKWAVHDGPVVAALRHDEVIGFAAATGDTLEGLFVLPSEAGAGVGTALLDAIGPVTRLWVLAENTTARAFYERRGWQWSGTLEATTFAGDVTKLLYVRSAPRATQADPKGSG
jgi:GNAT superfamily N-acetyltransferase